LVEELKPEDEDKAHREFIVKRFQDFPLLLNVSNGKFLEGLTIVINSLINMISSISNIMYVLKLMVEIVPWSVNLIKLMLFVVYFTIIYFIVEPEKLKHFTVITMLGFAFIGKIGGYFYSGKCGSFFKIRYSWLSKQTVRQDS